MDNMRIYNAVRAVPENAKREIGGGRLKGKTDISPMWRIKMLTELFGACGVGWYSEISKQWTEAGSNGEIAAFCNILLYIKDGDDWAAPIHGTGGAMLVTKEGAGLYTDDECFKKANTDAMSVACKSLGIGADVYWDRDTSKYAEVPVAPAFICAECNQPVKGVRSGDKEYTPAQVWESFGCCVKCHNARKKEQPSADGQV